MKIAKRLRRIEHMLRLISAQQVRLTEEITTIQTDLRGGTGHVLKPLKSIQVK